MNEKVALVTGGAAGIGAAICRRLVHEGNAVGVLDINSADASKVADEIVAQGGKAIPLQASIADRGQVSTALRDVYWTLSPFSLTMLGSLPLLPLRRSLTHNGTR